MIPTGLEKLTSLQYLSDFKVGGSVKRKSGKLNELKELNNIRGDLEISGLHLVEDVASEAQEANLKAKRHLKSLALTWRRGAINKNSDNLQLLDHLCPHQNLRRLRVEGYPGVGFSSWLSKLINIVEIDLFGFHSCQHVPPLERLPCLKTLWIRCMEELQWIHFDEISDVFFSSLETLLILNCKNLGGWQRLGDYNKPDDTCNHLSVLPFPRLSSLEIISCPNLTCMPPFPHLVERLELISGSMKPLIETCSVQLEPSSLSPLHALSYLVIGHEVTDAEATAEDWMQNLTSLKSLFFRGSSIIQHMFGHLQYLPAQLQTLGILYVKDDKLCLWEYEENNNMECQAPFQCLRSLQNITFYRCKMKALPEQIGDLQSLTHIEIAHCKELESLPEALCRLTNLQSLSIHVSPLLLDRCRDESGQDWPKIAHIPNREIY